MNDAIRIRVTVRTGNIAEIPVRDVLQTACHTGSAVVLHVGNVDDLRQRIGGQTYKVRACVVLAEKRDIHVRERIVSR